MRTVAILLVNEVEVLDFAGPDLLGYSQFAEDRGASCIPADETARYVQYEYWI